MADDILRLPQVIARTGLSRSSIYSRINDQTFPQPMRLGGRRAVGFLSSEIDAWIAQQVANRSSSTRAA